MRTYRFPFTLGAAVLAATLVILAVVCHIDVVKWDVAVIDLIERHEVDDLFTAMGLVVVGLLADYALVERRKAAQRDAQRLQVFKATMRTVQEIVNNFLNSFHLLRIDNEDVLRPQTLAMFDRLIEETAVKLRTLRDLEATPEKQLAGGFIGIDYEPAARGRSG